MLLNPWGIRLRKIVDVSGYVLKSQYAHGGILTPIIFFGECFTMSSISIQVIAHVLTDYYHCMHCERIFSHAGIGQLVHQEELDEYPEYVKEESRRLADWVFDLVRRYGSRIKIRVVDPQSIEGFFKALRYRVREYPTFIVDGRDRYTGWDQAALDAILEDRLAAAG